MTSTMDQSSSGDGRIGAVIWGLRSNGFNNNLVSHPPRGIDDVLAALHDERQLCFTQSTPFLSLERTEGHNLLTIFKVDALDNARNRAFIGITVFVPRNRQLKARSGPIPDAMLDLMRFYEQEQGNVVTRNQISEDDLSQKVSALFHQIDAPHCSGPVPTARTYAVCATTEEESKLLEGVAWANARQVILFRQEPDVIAAGLTGYERFTPDRKVEFVQPMDHVPRNEPREYRRKPKRNKRKVAFVLTLAGLTLIILGGGAWWALESNKKADLETSYSPLEPIHNNQIAADTTAKSLQPQDSVSEREIKAVANSAPQVQNKIIKAEQEKDNNDKSRFSDQNKIKKISDDCKTLCDKWNKSLSDSNATVDDQEARKKQWEEKDCPCKRKIK